MFYRKPTLIAIPVAVMMLPYQSAFAERLVKPHTFVPGGVISSQQVNENFDKLYEAVNKLINVAPVMAPMSLMFSGFGTSAGKVAVTDLEADPVTVSYLGGSGNVDGNFVLNGKDWSFTPSGATISALSNVPLQFSAGLKATDGQRESSGYLTIEFAKRPLAGSTTPGIGFAYAGPGWYNASYCIGSEYNLGSKLRSALPAMDQLSLLNSGICQTFVSGSGQRPTTPNIPAGQPGSIVSSGGLDSASDLNQGKHQLDVTLYPAALLDGFPLKSQKIDIYVHTMQWSGAPSGGFSITPHLDSASPLGGYSIERKVLVNVTVDGAQIINEELTSGATKVYAPAQSGSYRLQIVSVQKYQAQ